MPYGLLLNLLEGHEFQVKSFDSIYTKHQQPVQHVPCYKGHICTEQRVERWEPISPMMLPDNPEHPPEAPHSALRNFIKDAELLPPLPHRRLRRDQWEGKIQEQDRNRNCFYFPKRSHIRFGESGKSYCLASRVSSFPHPSRPHQTKNIYLYIYLTPRR